MRKTGFLYDERFLLHSTGPNHPESPERLLAALRGLQEAGLLPHLIPIKTKPAPLKWIEAVHAPKHIMRFEEACMLELGEYEHSDNIICKETYDVALLAVGGVLEAVRMLMQGEIDNAFCAIRPPGHHAEMAKALGFCYFNNVAIAARNLQREWGVGKVAIVDFDVHHGNGTQHIFEYDPTVLFYSIHEHPTFCFPGTGREFERGYDEGLGFTVNSPVLPGQGDQEYKECIERDMLPALESFKPEVILVSAGFDAHKDDDMADIYLSTDCFSWIMQTIMDAADAYAGGRVISVLEGGYCLERLPELIANHVRILLGL